MHKLILVAKREFIKTIRKPSFWLATLAFPIFMVFVSFISGYTSMQAEKKIEEELKEVKKILVIDESGLIKDAFYQAPYEKAVSLEDAIGQINNDTANALFVYQKTITTDPVISVYTVDDGIMSKGKYDEVARQLLKQSILMDVTDPAKITLFNSAIKINTTYYKAGEVVVEKLEKYVVPAISLVLYFIMVFMGTNFLLMSVSEEKENRMMEIVLTTMRSRDLVWGKLVGLLGIIFCQLVVLVSLTVVGLYLTSTKISLPVDLTQVPIDLFQIATSLFYIFCGFLIIATIMVGVGAAMPNYKDAQQFSSFFIIAAIFPIYFITLIIAEPMGLVARLTSYFPLTAPLVLLGRNALGGLPYWEALVSVPVLVLFVIGGFVLAFKLFDLGAFEYTQKISFKRLLSKGK